jgi:hypothetical protein
MIISKDKIEETRKQMADEYKKEVALHDEKYKKQYNGAASDDNSYPSRGQICDCGFLSYSSRDFGNHFYCKHHKQHISDETKKKFKEYLF